MFLLGMATLSKTMSSGSWNALGRPASGELWWSTLPSQNSDCRLFGSLCPGSSQSSGQATFLADGRGSTVKTARERLRLHGTDHFAVEASRELEAVYLPPAAEGDVYRVTLKRPQAIGIIDGYFQSDRPIRHKEILWAMSRGIHVFGSASIGALRAAELAAFGMEGVGTIFESYRDGVLEDDDEVAIVHGPPEAGFLAGSEAMVNIRQTLRESGVSSDHFNMSCEQSWKRIGKELFYPDRNYQLLASLCL